MCGETRINEIGVNRLTPLNLAIKLNKPKLVHILVENNANTEI